MKNFIAAPHPVCHDEWDVSASFYDSKREERLSIADKKQKRLRIDATDLPAATQFFTPKWIVKYILENSLGRLLGLKNLEYLDGGETFSVPIEDIKIFDPAAGTGNMFLYAYDLFAEAYKEKGLADTEIPPKVLSHFYGLDIDGGAAALAKRLLLGKAKLESFNFSIYTFKKPSETLLRFSDKNGLSALSSALRVLEKNPNLGSIIIPGKNLKNESDFAIENFPAGDDNECLNALRLLTLKYEVIAVNPPYLASSDYDAGLKEYTVKHYKPYKQDLFAVFLSRCLEWRAENGFISAFCPYNWMFLKTFYNLRKQIFSFTDIQNLAQLSTGGYSDAVVYLSAFVLKEKSGACGSYIRLTDFPGSAQDGALRKAINEKNEYRYEIPCSRFLSVPLNAVVYWGGEAFIKAFSAPPLEKYLDIRQGMATGDNKRFLAEAKNVEAETSFDSKSIEDFDRSGKLYAPYNKGGKFRKWYGNRNYCIRFDKEAREILKHQGNNMPSSKFYFKECVTWTLVSSRKEFGARYSNNSVFDVGGSCGFLRDSSPVSIFVILGYLCSKPASAFLNALNPTLNIQVGDLKRLPFIVPPPETQKEIEIVVLENVELARKDWYNGSAAEDFEKMRINEERLNKIFIELYGLTEMDYRVPDNLITLNKNKAGNNEK